MTIARKIPIQECQRTVLASSAQRGLWLQHQLDPEDSSYNMSTLLVLHGNLNVSALRSALQETLHRHEVLRATFIPIEGVLHLVLQEPSERESLIEEDFQNLPLRERHSKSRQRIQDIAWQPFDLTRGPLARFRLLRVGPEEWLFLLTIHHIVVDGWSMCILARELSVLYEALSQGTPSPLLTLPVEYADDEELLEIQPKDATYTSQLEYWKHRLDGAPERMELPSDLLHRSSSPRRSAGRVTFFVPAYIGDQLKTLTRRERATLFMVLLTAFQTLLYRYNEQEDLVTATLMAGRNRTCMENVIGLFSNLVPIRADLSGDPSFLELLIRTRQRLLADYRNQDVPFGELIQALHPERDLLGTPFASVVFALNALPQWSLPGLHVRMEEIPIQHSRFNLELAMVETREGLRGTIEFNADLFDTAMISRFAGHFRNLLAAVAINPLERIDRIPLLGADERRLLLEQWNPAQDSQRELYSLQCIHQLFEAQVKRTPDDVALVFKDDSICYRELNEQANALAHELRIAGVGPETFVGVCVERSVEVVVALLAVLKAGGAYVPLDPTYPFERLTLMLKDSGATVLLTETAFVETFSEWNGLVLSLDMAAVPDLQCFDNPNSEADPDNTAYVLYTSGSTGIPKGVVVRHRNVANFFSGITPWVDEPASARTWLAVTTISFDISVLELLWTICHGYRVIIHPDNLNRSISAEILEHSVSHLQCTPSLASIILEAPGGLAALGQLRRLMIGGEVFPAALAQRLRDVFSGDLLNLYGPTETTIWSAVHRVEKAESTIPIGRPIANTEIYILDKNHQPTPVGVPGEIFIAGDGVARGYLNRPDLTDERFIPNPFSKDPNSRMYCTGDRARFQNGGTIEFLGRLDHQIKIRGHRIELEEVEAMLRTNPGVQDAVVAVAKDETGSPRLAAYVVPNIKKMDPAELESESAAQLSEWKKVWNDTFSQSNLPDPTFNTSGWTSSYTGEPIPELEMREWVDATAAQILSLNPKRVLEIGCGTGLMLFRIAPRCEVYIGTDVSPRAIDILRRRLVDKKMGHVKVEQRDAHDTMGLDSGSFDMVILNSIVQYFPSVEYLMRVLKGISALVSAGGCVFLGDIRNLDLLESFHASLAMSQMNPNCSCQDLTQRIARNVRAERELLIAPAFFKELHRGLPRVRDVKIQLKRGRYLNEMTRFRYDVTVRLDSRRSHVPERHLSWLQDNLSLETFVDRIRESSAETIRVNGIPNARLRMEQGLAKLLKDPRYRTVKQLKESLSIKGGIDPEEIWTFQCESDFQIRVEWARDDPFSFDACIRILPTSSDIATEMIEYKAETLPFSTSSNTPLRSRQDDAHAKDLRRWLQKKLPDCMVPSTLVIVEAIPRKPNGKFDRQALLIPDDKFENQSANYLAPTTTTEKSLAQIYAEILKVPHVSSTHNFFDLGGHSLLAVLILTRISKLFGVNVSLRELFIAPTVVALARLVDELTISAAEKPFKPIPKIPDKEPFPLSVLQEGRLFFEFASELRAVHYVQGNVPFGLEIEGRLDLQNLERAINIVIGRHQVLRTGLYPRASVGAYSIARWANVRDLLRFAHGPLKPAICFTQEVQSEASLKLFAVDLETFDPTDREVMAHSMTAELIQQRFDYESPPLMRALIVRMNANRHLLIIIMSHLISDGWSLGVLQRELWAIYDTLLKGISNPLPDLPIQYSDFAAWQRLRLTSEALRNSEAYWEVQFRDFVPLSIESLPFTRQNPMGTTLKARIERSVLENCNGLRSFARQSKVTLYVLLLTGFFILLRILTGKERINVWTFFANRVHPDTENLIGWFANDRMLAVDFSADPNLMNLMMQVNETVALAHTHQEIPSLLLTKFISKIQGQGLASSRIMFELLPHEHVEAVPELSVRRIVLHRNYTEFPLRLLINDSGKDIEIAAQYRADRFDDVGIRSMLTALQAVIQWIPLSANERVSSLYSNFKNVTS